MFDKIAGEGVIQNHIPEFPTIRSRVAHDGIGPEHAIDYLFDVSRFFCLNTQEAIHTVREMFGEKKFLFHSLKHETSTAATECEDYASYVFSVGDAMQNSFALLNCNFFNSVNRHVFVNRSRVAPQWIKHKVNAIKKSGRLINYCYMPHMQLLEDLLDFLTRVYETTHQFYWFENKNANFSVIGLSLYSNEAFQITTAGEEALALYDVINHQVSLAHNSFQDNRGRDFPFQ